MITFPYRSNSFYRDNLKDLIKKYIRQFPKLLIFLSFLIYIYILFLLVSNVSRGFDITDESFYILSALSPEDVTTGLSSFGNYTELLFWLSNYNLSYFRLLGELLLSATSIWFGIELYKYLTQKNNFVSNNFDKLLFIIPIGIGGLSYYKLWLITPSYNLISLVLIQFIFIFLFRIVRNKNLNYHRYISWDYVLISLSFSLLYFIKPSSALVLLTISILFIIYEYKRINLKKSILSVFILTVLFLFLQIILFYGSFDTYYTLLFENLKRSSLLGAGNDINSVYKAMVSLSQNYFFEDFYFHKINNIYIYIIIFIITSLLFIRNKHHALNLYLTLMFLVLIVYSYVIVDGMDNNYNLIWLRIIELFLLNLFLVLTTLLFINEKKISLINIYKLLPIVFILILGSFAYVFGTANNFIYAMSNSMIFIIAPLLILNFIFDQTLNTRIFTTLSGLVISIVIYYSIIHGFEHPYRLITNIEAQNKQVSFLGGLTVDKTTKKFIEDLQRISHEHKKYGEVLSLIDMTGGTPGANIILNAKFFGKPWLIGGYKGSNLFAYTILKDFKNTDRLKNAWILTAPEGGRKFDLNILNELGLNFPQHYKKIGTVQTAHRNELQEVWKPIF